jgi:hypothetical protein
VLIRRRVRRQPRGETPPLRALSPHEPPAISKPAQTAPLFSRGEVPEAKVGTRRRALQLRRPVPGMSDTLDASPKRTNSQRWQRPGGELGGEARGGCGFGLAVPNSDEPRMRAGRGFGPQYSTARSFRTPGDMTPVCAAQNTRRHFPKNKPKPCVGKSLSTEIADIRCVAKFPDVVFF